MVTLENLRKAKRRKENKAISIGDNIEKYIARIIIKNLVRNFILLSLSLKM
jgi:hypothetical protein